MHSIEATPLAADYIKLNWDRVADAMAYRVYSDMGTGYGVYVYKAETEGYELTDVNLRAGLGYRYRVTSVTTGGEKVVARVGAVTADYPGSQAADQPKGQVREIAPAAQAGTPQQVHSSVRVTPAPTPLPPDTIILGLLSASDYADEVENSLTIVGEVRNDTQLNVGETAVTATFYATDGQVIGEASGATLVSTLAPGMRSPFVITLPRPAGLANYSLRATGRPITVSAENTELHVLNTRRFEDTTGFYHIAGVVENQSQRRVEGARVIVTLYDRAGRVVNVGFAYPQPSSLSPSDRADFDVAFTYYPKVYEHLAIAVRD